MWSAGVDSLADSSAGDALKTLFHNVDRGGLQCNPLLWYNSGVQKKTNFMVIYFHNYNPYWNDGNALPERMTLRAHFLFDAKEM